MGPCGSCPFPGQRVADRRYRCIKGRWHLPSGSARSGQAVGAREWPFQVRREVTSRARRCCTCVLYGSRVRTWPSFRQARKETGARSESRSSSRVRSPRTLPVSGCPAVTDGLDCDLVRLQDRSAGRMAPVCRRVTRPDRDGAYPARPVAVVAARAAVPPVGAAAPEGREAWPRPGRRVSARARSPARGLPRQWRSACAYPHLPSTPGRSARARRASRALETVEKVVTGPKQHRHVWLRLMCDTVAPLDL